MSSSMTRVSTLVSKDIGNYLTNRQTWSITYILGQYATGNGTTDDAAAINTLITTIGSDEATIVVDANTYRLGAAVTVPSNVTLMFLQGGILSPDSGKTLTINGPVDAGIYQIFSGSGSIAGTFKSDRFYPQWMGVVADGTTDDTVLYQKALTTAQNCQVTLYHPRGTYLVDEIDYGNIALANQISIIGEDRDLTILKKKTSDGDPLFVIATSDGTIYTSNITIANMTFQGIAGNTPASLRAYNMVRSRIENCRFTSSINGLDFQGGIANELINVICDFNQFGWYLRHVTNVTLGGYPNINQATSCQFVDNTKWGVNFDDGKVLNLEDCDIEGNGTAADATTGGLYVGSNVGAETAGTLSIGANVNVCWVEGNVGDGGVQLNGGRNNFSQCYFVANTGTYDIHINGGRYDMQSCDGDTTKTPNVLEEAAVLNGNYIFDCDFANITYDADKTMVFNQGNAILMNSGSVPAVQNMTRPFIQQGIDSTASGVVTVTFAVAFTATPRVIVTMNNDSAGTLDAPEVYSVSTTGFTVRKKSITSGSATVGTTTAGFYWIAIGTK